MKLRKALLYFMIIYLLIGFGFAVYGQIIANPNDPPPMPVWAPGLSLSRRLMSLFLYFLPSVLLWPIFLPPTIYHAIKNALL
jgi:hypothetical protein